MSIASTANDVCTYCSRSLVTGDAGFNCYASDLTSIEALPEAAERQAGFRFHYISSDEVFGSLGATGRFSETTPTTPAVPREADPGGDPQGGRRRADPTRISTELGGSAAGSCDSAVAGWC